MTSATQLWQTIGLEGTLESTLCDKINIYREFDTFKVKFEVMDMKIARENEKCMHYTDK